MRSIYLDYNASTPIAPPVRAAMEPFLREHFALPSSLYAPGRITSGAIEDARSKVARLLGVDRLEITFTSGGTESNNLAIIGLAMSIASGSTGHLLISDLEHESVVSSALFLESLGYDIDFIPCDENGLVAPETLNYCIRKDTFLVSITHASYDFGTIQPIRELAKVCRNRNVMLHTDASQTVGKISVRPRDLNVDLLTISGHKMYAPKGVGALYVRRGVPVRSIYHGKNNEWGLRPGTENVPGIVGLGAAADLAAVEMQREAARIEELRDRMQQRIADAIPACRILGIEAERLPGTLTICFPSVNSAEMIRKMPELYVGIYASVHSDCDQPPRALEAIGLDSSSSTGVIRISLGRSTTEDEIDLAAAKLIEAWHASRNDLG